MGVEYTRIVFSLFAVVFLIILLVYFLKKFKLAKFVGNNKHIRIINSVSIGVKERIILMEVNKVILLVGATPSHIETLYVFNELETASPSEYIDHKKLFSETLNNLTK